MTRVAVNPHAGWIAAEPTPTRAVRGGNGPLSPAPFDQHLEQAQRLAATPPGSPAPPSSNGPPQPPPSRPASPSQSTSDAPPQAPESRDPPSGRPSDPDRESSPPAAETPPREDSHRDGKEKPDDPVGDAAAAASEALATIAGTGDATPAPAFTGHDGVHAISIAREAEKVKPAADDKTRVAAGKQPHPKGNLRDKPAKPVEPRIEVSESQVPSTGQNGENADVPTELKENAEPSAFDAKDREKPRRVPEGKQPSIPSSKVEDRPADQPTSEVQLPAVGTVDLPTRPANSDPAAKAADDRVAEGGVRRIDARRSAKAASPATSGSAQPRTEEDDAGPQAAVPREGQTTATTAQAVQGERETPSGETKSDRPNDAKASDAPLPRSSSARETESVGQRTEPEAPTDESQHARFVQRVVRAFESAADRGGHVRLRLHPPELGALRLELTVRDGQMHARLETETEAARNLLLDHLPELKERLASHQIRVERFDVEWRGQAHGGPPQGFGDPGRWQGPPAGRAGRGPEAVATSPAANPAENVARRPSAQTSFDVLI